MIGGRAKSCLTPFPRPRPCGRRLTVRVRSWDKNDRHEAVEYGEADESTLASGVRCGREAAARTRRGDRRHRGVQPRADAAVRRGDDGAAQRARRIDLSPAPRQPPRARGSAPLGASGRHAPEQGRASGRRSRPRGPVARARRRRARETEGEMSAEVAEADALTTIRREIERNALRARNGLKYLTGARFVRTGTTPRDLVWSHGKSQLWRYRNDHVTRRPPIVMYVGLVGRSYVFDLYPGNSFVQKLMDQGFDVFLIDWGVPDEVEARNTIATYTLDLLPRAIDAMLEATGDDEVPILGYCMAGCFTVASLGAGTGLPVKSLILAAMPTDFSKMGEFFGPLRSGSFDPDSIIDETGNVPGSLVRISLRIRQPT